MNTFDYKNYLAAGGVNQQLTEAQIHEEIEKIFEEFLNDPSNENLVKEEKEQLEESITGLIVGTILSFPKLLALLGKVIKKIAKLFGKDTSAEKAAEWLEKKGEGLERKYIKFLMKIIKVTGFAKKIWKKEDGKIDMIKLKYTAEILMAVILIVAALLAAGTAVSEIGQVVAGKGGSAIVGAVEGILSGVKTSEIIPIVTKVGPKLFSA